MVKKLYQQERGRHLTRHGKTWASFTAIIGKETDILWCMTTHGQAPQLVSGKRETWQHMDKLDSNRKEADHGQAVTGKGRHSPIHGNAHLHMHLHTQSNGYWEEKAKIARIVKGTVLIVILILILIPKHGWRNIKIPSFRLRRWIVLGHDLTHRSQGQTDGTEGWLNAY